MQTHLPATLAAARRLRRQMSLPEILLWQALRGRPGGFKFRKQHPVGGFVADFYCASVHLIIEVDGEAHDRGDRPERDAARDAYFLSRDIRVLRIPARDVLNDLDAVVRHIVASAHAAPPPSALRAATSPGGGGIVVEH
jgi:very-short-patch-repair endonuclease